MTLNIRPLTARRMWTAASLALTALLCACGGGGGGGGAGFAPGPLPAAATAPEPAATSDDPIVASSSVAGQCAAPRAGIDPATGTLFQDSAGSFATEKRWVRSWIDETYLWYDEVPPLAAADYATPIVYFNVLKTPALTPSGRPKDRFHFTQDTASYRTLTQNGVEVGYGAELAYLSSTVPRDIRVAYTEAGSPAAQAAMVRGTRIIEIDGVDAIAGTDTTTLNAALAPRQEGEVHTFRLRAPDGSERSATLTAARITRTPVQNVKTIAGSGGPVGYLLFNDHLATAEAQLIAAIDQLKNAGIVDLVVDMRYNGGGLLDVASELAYMIGPAAATTGTVFERLEFNRKNPFDLSPAQTALPFHAVSRGLSGPAGQPLPKLGLSRVTVLAGPDTCSASESVVNGLRGVGVAVTLVGGATCGKPYGFYPKDNCGTTFFAIQFRGVNQAGFGDYGDGFAPTCAVADDFGHALGDPAEARLAAALVLQGGGACPAASAVNKTQLALQKAEAEGRTYLQRSALRENRLLLPSSDTPQR
ncbi:MAG: peptidase S41 [Gammaproteobacteria bacterium]|nr:peptidase S41 [Gammaproteobacteria bacterium]